MPKASGSGRAGPRARTGAAGPSVADAPAAGAAPDRRTEAVRQAAARRGTVVGVGLATTDLLCVAPRMEERLVELSVFSMQGGGSAANAIAALATLGARARFFGRLGDDDFGRFLLRGLRDIGVDTAPMSIERGKVSPISIIQIDELSRKRRILFTRGTTSPLAARDLPRGLLDGAAVLCIDGYQPALQAVVAEKARDKRIPVLLNAATLSGGMGDLLGLSDIVIGSERFATEFAPSDQIEKSLREMTRIGPHTAVITLGDEGVAALHGDKFVQLPAIDVFVADSTGAGDAFCGAFAFGTLCAWPLERTLRFANAAAGLSCRALGSRAGLPSLGEVLGAAAAG